jgi:hypothetical protein
MHHYACESVHFSTSISRAIAIARLVPCHHLLKRGPHTSYRPSGSSSSANRPPFSSPAPDGIYRPRLIEYDAHAHRAPKCRARTPEAPRPESCTAPPPRSRGGMKHRRRPHHRHKARACAPWPAAPPPPWQGPPPAAPSSRPCGSHSGRDGRSRSGTPSACRAQSRGALPRWAARSVRRRPCASCRLCGQRQERRVSMALRVPSAGTRRVASERCRASVLSHPTRARAVHRLRA